MFGKRGFCEAVAAEYVYDATAKRRRCGWEEVTTPAPGRAAEDAACQLLASVLPAAGNGLQGRTNTLEQASMAIPAQAWVAFAELNVQLQHHAQLMREVPLRSYHSFTRGSKATVFQRVVDADADRQFPADRGAPPAKQLSTRKLQTSSRQGSECWQPVWRPQELPVYLQMASTVLQTAFGRYADASICMYSFTPPPCLAEWCRKWCLGCEADGTLALLAVNAHTSDSEVMHVAGGEACPFPGSSVHTLFVPVVRS